MVREQVPADLVVSDSKDSAIASIAERLPDLILVSALMSPREEAELTEHLRGLEDADHLQTLTIPLLASKPARSPSKGKVLRALKWRRARSLEGCDPCVFADEIRGYLERAGELRAQRELDRAADEEVAIARAQELAASEASTEAAVTEQPPVDPMAVPADDGELLAECHGAPSTEAESETLEVADATSQASDAIEPVDVDVLPVIEPPVAATPTVERVASEVSDLIELPQASQEWVEQLAQPQCLAREDADSPPAILHCAPPIVEQIPIEQPTPPPATASSGERVLRLVKTGKRGSSRRHPTVPFKPSPAPANRQPAQPIQPPPIQDEWAIHDPRKCGFGALMARLDAVSDGDSASGSPDDQGDVSSRHGGGGSDKRIVSPAGLPRSRKRRVTPLAIWAHAEAEEPEAGTRPDDLQALFTCLSLPPGIAAVSYPTGCRIRRIRVAPPAHAESAAAFEKKTIILSRRLLRQIQHRDDASRADRATHGLHRPPSMLAGAGP